jgi:AcrR family transcriptional regulator
MTASKPSTRKEEILQVATRLFRARGYHGTRMDDVADAAGLNKATVYHYYDSKATILYDLYIKAANEIEAVVRTVEEDASPVAELMGYVHQTFELIVSDMAQASVYFQESPFLDQWLSAEQVAEIRAREVVFDRHVRGIFKRGIDSGVFLDFDVNLLTVGFIGMTSWFYRWYDVSSSRYAPEDVAWEFGRIFLSGILVDRSLTPAPRPRRRRKTAAAAG